MRDAAGGVVWRPSPNGGVDVLVVHRPRRDDWSLPKGGVRRNERAVDAARREVLEETGLACEVGPELALVAHVGRKGRPKRTRYWAMRAVAGEFRPNDEVDRVRWVDAEHAAAALTYPHEAPVVALLVAQLDVAGRR